jgi:hypothetical protein
VKRIVWERRDDVWVEDGQKVEETVHVAMVATGSDSTGVDSLAKMATSGGGTLS